MLVALTGIASALNPLTPHEEYYKKIRASEMLQPLSSDLFGDSINLSSGSTEFVVTDIDIPGNAALPVRLQRRLAIQSFKEKTPLGGFGGWDIEVPYVHGTFDATYKWNEGGNGLTTRCSGAYYPKVTTPFRLHEMWSGTFAHLPGQGDQEMLYIGGAAPNPKPVNGGTYYWGTRGDMRLSCLDATANGYPGQGFVGLDSAGNRYFFNVGIEREAGVLEAGGNAKARQVNIYLMASRVEDRYGNWVAYDYAGDRLTGIRGSDGRAISLAYSGNQIASASANGRTWSYSYAGSDQSAGFARWPRLEAVVQPDGSRMTYGYGWSASSGGGGLYPEYESWDGSDYLCQKPSAGASTFSLTATHPAGAQAQFDFAFMRFNRTGVKPIDCANYGGRYVQRPSASYDQYSITRKVLSGPGLTTQVWSYERGGYDPGIANTAVSTVVEPDGTRRHNVFGIKVDENEGQLLQVAVRASDGQIVQVSSNSYVTAAEAPSQPFPDSHGLISAADAAFASQIRPLKSTTLSQDGDTFSTQVTQFDVFARALAESESNSLGYSRTLRTAFHDDTTRWVLGQVSRRTQSSATTGETETERTDFDTLSRPYQTYAFGLLQQRLGYHADGTLASVADGNGHAVTLNGWKRGLPQQVGFPDGTGLQLQVDDNGWVGNVVEPNGASRSYGYDAMGRTASATQAASDSVAWNPSSTVYQQVAQPEAGLEAGHWRRDSTTGNARAVTYYDALWRPVLEESFDNSDRPGTLRQQVTRYDVNGQPAFGSYPTRTAGDFRSALPGTHTSYDTLGRVIRSEQDSELGRLATTTQYLSGGRIQVVNSRGHATTSTFQMFAKPNFEAPVQISHANGAVTEIQRDLFGKPLSILRRNTDASLSVRRQYVYDGGQRLCKSMEPESGATAQGYDAAGNVVWSAPGLALLGAQCDAEQAMASPSRHDRGYDSMGRLLSLRFSDAQGDQDWTYWPGGKVKRVQTRNSGALVINEYNYNLRGLPVSETAAHDGGQSWSIGYGYDANGALATLQQPSGLMLDFSPNALGQPTRAGTYATAVRYFANGAMSSFTYGNGITHQMSQNARGLPDRSLDSRPGGSVLDDGYDYDATGNVVAISDGLPGSPGNRDMGYDAADRLTNVTAAGFGNASYGYDVLDNIVAITVGPRSQLLAYDHTNRLTNVREQAGGATVIGLSYDAQGNLRMRNGVNFRFDLGNRLREVDGKERYQYDAHGRRVLAEADSGTIRSMYGQDGVLRYQHDQRQAKAFDYITLNGSLVAKRAADILPAALVIRGPGYSNEGSYQIEWNAVAGAQLYEIQEAEGASWLARYQGSGLSTTISGRTSGSYRYRGRVCTVAGCGNWGAEAVVQVERAPDGAPAISAPAVGLNGSYVVSWSQVTGAADYVLEEQSGGTWAPVYSGALRSLSINGKPAGTHRYRAKACNPQGCSGYSVEVAVRALHAPAVPAISTPPTSHTGSFSIAIGAVADASSYTIEQMLNGGGWTELVRTSNTSVSVTGRSAGAYGYRASACNEAGCSTAGATVHVQVTLPPTAATTLSLGGVSYSSTVSMSWGAVGAATYYQLMERANGGGFALAYQDAATAVALGGRGPAQWEYQVRGCNVAGCGPWSALAGVRVIGPPGAPQVDLPTTSGAGVAYTVTVSQVAEAIGYELDESSDGVNWGVVSYSRSLTTSKGGGTYYYRARGCNPAGCGASSSVGQIVVSSAPPVPTGVRISIRTSTRCQVTFGDSPGATHYEVLEDRTGMIYPSGAALWETDMRCAGPYKVRACNAQACSAWSAGAN